MELLRLECNGWGLGLCPQVRVLGLGFRVQGLGGLDWTKDWWCIILRLYIYTSICLSAGVGFFNEELKALDSAQSFWVFSEPWLAFGV